MALKFPFHSKHSVRCEVVRETSNDRPGTTAIGDDGKDVIKATTDDLMLIEGVLPNINLPINGLPPFWKKVLNWSAKKEWKKSLRKEKQSFGRKLNNKQWKYY